jgi:hypothetical protein
MQSFNVVYFQSVKHYHRKAIDEAVRLGVIKFPLIEFFSTFEYIRAQIFKRETIILVFEWTGIYSLNTQKVVKFYVLNRKSLCEFIKFLIPHLPLLFPKSNILYFRKLQISNYR